MKKYKDRIREYEREKTRLMQSCLTAKEYEKAIRELATKLRV